MLLILAILTVYISLFLHELGHCVVPKIFGVNTQWTINIGTGDLLLSIKFSTISIHIHKVLIPFGYVEGNKKYYLNSKLGFTQFLAFNLGGILVNLIIAIILFTILYFNKTYESEFISPNIRYSNYIIHSIFNSTYLIFTRITETWRNFQMLLSSNKTIGIFTLAASINSFLFVSNILPLPIFLNKRGNLILTDGGYLFKMIVKGKLVSEKKEI